MGRQHLDVDRHKTVGRRDATHGDEREIGKVLVVDRVELVLGDEAPEMRDLDGHNPVRCQQMGDAGNEVVELGHLRQHVIGDDQVGVALLRRNLVRHLGAEEGDARGHALGASRRRHVGRRLDAEHPLTERKEMLQEIAVIAAKLDHETFGAKLEPRLVIISQ